MELKITENGNKTYNEIISKYAEVKAKDFAKETISIIEMIENNNHIGSRYKKTPYRKFLVSSQIYLFYKIEFEVIYIVLFWDNKRNPLELDIILSS